MHGDTHVYDKFGKKNDYFGHGGGSEFYGHTYNTQVEKIPFCQVINKSVK